MIGKSRSIKLKESPLSGFVTEPSEPAPVGKFEALGAEVGALCDQKNAAYGDSAFVVADFLRILCPDGVKPEQYDLLCIFARDVDKWARLFRVGNSALGEDAAADRVGYGLLLCGRLRSQRG